MDECDYCSSSFDDEERYLRHLRDEHWEELGSIDRRRVEQLGGDGGVPTTPLLAAAGVGLMLVALVAYVFLSGGGGGPPESAAFEGSNNPFADSVRQPTAYRSVHYHGPMTVTIEGETLDFSKDQYQLRDDFFHFESGRGDRWHVHGKGVTLEYALESLGIGVTRGSLAFEGEIYNASDPDVTLIYEVDGESVDPETYVLQKGDRVRVVVRTEG